MGDGALILGDPSAALARSVMMSDERRAYLAKRWAYWQKVELDRRADPHAIWGYGAGREWGRLRVRGVLVTRADTSGRRLEPLCQQGIPYGVVDGVDQDDRGMRRLGGQLHRRGIRGPPPAGSGAQPDRVHLRPA